MSGRPLDVLEDALGEPVTVRLKSGEEYAGELDGYDQHMNLVLSRASVADDETASTEDTTIIRGDNVVSITP
ncbi:LSM domain-containing protein [Halovivax gelatinilyticus]|uniref:LSM domain-containing protein n=1 Tax=Halovivax gelatinilyticus TaxID=2961597 RepID=UPI0020CA7EB4|nr:LSM domain-containing protein [Halovivax gelatinilyticus]